MDRHASLCLLALLCVACDNATGPRSPGRLAVTTRTTGLGMASFMVAVDDARPRPVSPNDSISVDALSAGQHTVLLSQIPGNCTVQGPNPQVVVVADNATVRAAFQIQCVATT